MDLTVPFVTKSFFITICSLFSLFLSITKCFAHIFKVPGFLVFCLQALSIYQNRDFITIYHGEQEAPNDFDTVLLKALVGGIYD